MKTAIYLLLLCLSPVEIMANGAPSPSNTARTLRTVVPVTVGQSVVALAGPWKFHIGDDPRWADPGFDDSAWQSYELMQEHSALTLDELTDAAELPGWQQHGHPAYTGYAWYRVRLSVLEDNRGLALLMPRHADDAYEVYLNGSKIGAFGKLEGWRLTWVAQAKLFSIPSSILDHGQPAVLALRFWSRRGEASPDAGNLAGGLRGIPVVGPGSLLRIVDARERDQQREFQNDLMGLMQVAGLYAAVGFVSLFLFLFSGLEREYLWAGISLTGFGAMLAFIGWMGQAVISFQMSIVGQTLGDSAAIFAMPLAAMYLLGVPKPQWRRLNYVVFTVNLMWSLQLAGFDLGVLPPTAAFNVLRGASLWVAVLLLGCLLVAIAIDGVRTIGKKAWLPMTPGLIFAVYCIFYTLGLSAHPFARFLCTSVPIAVLIIFLMRFTEQQRDNARMADDMRQAQEVQRLLVPRQIAELPGWKIDSEYRPAREVGGDFFQVLPGDDGSLLIVVGDVSGKGLQAAMTVSAIVGALRDSTYLQPAQILAHLNRVLYGQIAGFVTCSATLIAESGIVTVANAGHLPPYCNGSEARVPNGLPLGLLPNADYDEAMFHLAPADHLTFLSDGVIEARDTKGELLGFERMARLAGKPAAEIADIAQRWGQEDDITVLTVARAPKPEALTV